MVSVLDSIWGLAGDIVLCSWARQLINGYWHNAGRNPAMD